MNSILYHQKIREDRQGRMIYIGEDAYPYADDSLIIVADGLGGRGGYPHTKIDPRILSSEELYGLVFAPIFPETVTEEFRSFAVSSFREIFETRAFYFENSSTTRSSGYFASRLVSAIARYELTYNPSLARESIFAAIRSTEPEAVDALVQAYGDTLADLIRQKLSRIAENVGFEVETRISGAYLLPSTLTATVMDDQGDHVDALYFWAGDSRGYVWDGQGLAQVTEDHERDETMTNLITLTKPFRVEARFLSIPKPCILFNATDGCYKCPVFDSPFDLEYIFLKSIDDASDFMDASHYLSVQFHEIGRHDDSNTMALAAFGYADYEQLQAAARARLATIDETIIAKLPGILQINYPAELQALEEAMATSACIIKDELIKEIPVMDYVKLAMSETGYAPMQKELRILMDRRSAAMAHRDEVTEELRRWIEDGWIRHPQLKRHSSAAKRFKSSFLGLVKKDPYEQYAALTDRMTQTKQAHETMITELTARLGETSGRLREALSDLRDIKKAAAFDASCIAGDRDALLQILDNIRALGRHDTPAMQEHRAIAREIKELNQLYVELDADAIAEVLNAILERHMDLRGIRMRPNAEGAVTALLSEYNAHTEELQALDAEITGLSEKHLLPYWMDRGENLILTIWQEHRDLIPAHLADRLSEGMIDLQARYDEMKQCCITREAIYADYDRLYRRMYRGSQL